MTTQLNDKHPLEVEIDSGKLATLPNPYLFSKFELLHYFLEETVNDWHRMVAPYNANYTNAASENEQILAFGRGFIELQRPFFRCLFAYLMFFVATKQTYDTFFMQLRRARKALDLPVETKKPKLCDVIRTAIRVRNLSIAHIGAENSNPADRLASLTWEPLSFGKSKGESCDFAKMNFGNLSNIKLLSKDGQVAKESENYKLPDLPTLHERCMEFIHEYDEVCVSFLDDLHAKRNQI